MFKKTALFWKDGFPNWTKNKMKSTNFTRGKGNILKLEDCFRHFNKYRCKKKILACLTRPKLTFSHSQPYWVGDVKKDHLVDQNQNALAWNFFPENKIQETYQENDRAWCCTPQGQPWYWWSQKDFCQDELSCCIIKLGRWIPWWRGGPCGETGGMWLLSLSCQRGGGYTACGLNIPHIPAIAYILMFCPLIDGNRHCRSIDQVDNKH